MTQEHTASCGCAEYEALERRQFLSLGWRVGALAAASAPMWLPKLAFATGEPPAASPDLLVVVFLRGGADGLTLCAPFGDANYAAARPILAVPPPDSSEERKAIDLNGFFGLPPALAPLKPIYDAGHLAIVHAVGNPLGVRSHFFDQDQVEISIPNFNGGSTGWLSRHLLSRATAPDQIRAVSTGFSLARSIAGAPASVALPSDNGYGLIGRADTAMERRTLLRDAYTRAGAPLANYAGQILTALEIMGSQSRSDSTVSADSVIQSELFDAGFFSEPLASVRSDVNPTEPIPLGMYPNNGWGRALQSVARLAKAEIGLEAATIDLTGWDTHAGQGTLDGSLNNLMSNLALGIEAFYNDMQSRLGSTTMIVMSEFGRRVAANASAGCDHGRGGVMFVIGGNVNGRNVFTDWPGLHPDQLEDHLDLRITTDYRDVLGEILVKRAGSTALPIVFPGYNPVFRGIVR